MTNLIVNIEKFLFGTPLMLLLLGTHVFFTIYLKFPQKDILKAFKYILEKKNNKISPYKALMTCLASTLGTGNIIGIASAILVGGVGSLFWIFISGIFAIATKYIETYVVLKYRKKNGKKYVGGAMYILDEVLDKKNLAVIFAIFLIITTFCSGAMLQANAIYSTAKNVIKIDKSLLTICITILAGYIIFGNEQRIAKFSSIFVPIATMLYLFTTLALLIYFKDNILDSIKLILSEAFNFKSALGGFLGSNMIIAMKEGLNKGLFTNEAGLGTSPIFDVNVENVDIHKQSIISASSVFIDTVVLCSLTGILFVASGLYNSVLNAESFAIVVYDIFPYGKEILVIFLSIFAFTTIPCSCYYGWCAINYVLKNKKSYEIIYKLVYLICIYLGSKLSLDYVWSLSSIFNIFIMLPNIYMIYKLRKIH